MFHDDGCNLKRSKHSVWQLFTWKATETCNILCDFILNSDLAGYRSPKYSPVGNFCAQIVVAHIRCEDADSGNGLKTNKFT